jgi:formylglycine-generating enzyme required for sulfatase activity
MSQVFISYSRIDAAFVELFIRRLQRAFPDLKIWHDQAPHGLIGGGNWWNDILTAIAAADVFIYILSNESVNSLYCQAEFTEARRLQKRIITVQARDRTELTDDLDDIQFIDMKDGVDYAEAFASLVAAVNLRLRESLKYRNTRPLWKPATPKPQKEQLPTRSVDATDVETPPLEKPTAEQEALRLARSGVRWQVIGVVISVILGVAALALTAAQLLRDNLPAAPPALPVATNFEIADAPTQTESPSATLTPSITATATDDLAATQAAQFQASRTALGALQEQGAQTATADVATRAAASQLDATLRAAADTATEDAIAITQAVLGETATQQSAEATRTREADIANQNLTATADAWTDTPTPTSTPSPISPTPTSLPDPLDAALAAARAFNGTNADWQALYPDGFQHTFDDGVPMVLVPAGCFMMGGTLFDDQQPIHRQCFEVPFWIDKTEVSNAQYARIHGTNLGTSALQLPVTGINWFGARDYCEARDARLPSEREWEYSARGPDSLSFPWGNVFEQSRIASTTLRQDVESMSNGASWIGALRLAGNAAEWTISLFAPYPYIASDGREDITNIAGGRVARGIGAGSIDPTIYTQLSIRQVAIDPNWAIEGGSFRCARSQ